MLRSVLARAGGWPLARLVLLGESHVEHCLAARSCSAGGSVWAPGMAALPGGQLSRPVSG
jgi:hypothetical protein